MGNKQVRAFTSTCEKDYDRHKYKLVLKDGRELVLEDYEHARAYWHQFRTQLSHVEVLDGETK